MAFIPNTQYTEGDVDATITGTAVIWEDAADTLRVVSAAKPFPVSVAAVPLPSGAATETTLGTRLSESDFDTKTGSLTEPAPATDTASSGSNGRLQRIAQRLTSLIALLPAALVGGRLDVNLGAAPATVTSTETRPTSTVTLVDFSQIADASRALTLLAANASRRGVTLKNDTDTAIKIKEGASPSETSYTDILPPGASYVLDFPASTSILTAYLPQTPSGRMLATERS